MLDLKALLTKMLQEKPVLYDHYTIPSRTYAANSTTWLYSLNLNVPQHEGYIPVGIVGVSPSAQSLLVCAPIVVYPSYGHRIAGYIRNTGSSALTDSIILSLLYVKSSRLEI